MRHRSLPLLGAGLCAASLAAVLPATGDAQALRLRVVDSATSSPIAGALLDLEMPDGRAVLRSYTSPDGRRLLGVPQPGEYRLRVRRLGHRPWVSTPLIVAGADTIALTLQVPSLTVRLPVVARRERDVCGLNAARNQDEASRIVSLWEQIRTSLELTQASRAELRADRSVGEVGRFISRVAPRGSALLRHTVLPTRRGAPRPFATVPPEELARNGYVRHDEEGAVYIAPDERALLSDGFAATHCFRLTRGVGENQGLLGIVFSPARTRRVPEIAGTIWADSANGALRFVEFRYVDESLPEAARGRGGAGGETHFAATSTGDWIVSAWRLRLPKIWTPPYERDGQLLYFAETGGVAAFAHAPGAPAEHAGVARLRDRLRRGSVVLSLRDSTAVNPLAGAWVVLRQRRDGAARLFEGDGPEAGHAEAEQALVERGAVSDAAGRVRLDDLEPGRYDVSYEHPVLDSLGVEPPTAEIEASADRPFELALHTPRKEDLVARCRRKFGHELRRTLYGVVYEGDGALAPDAIPASGARVTVSWTGADGSPQTLTASPNHRGEFTVCGVPDDAEMTVQATISRSRSDGANAGAAARTESPKVTLRMGLWGARFLRLTVKTNPLA